MRSRLLRPASLLAVLVLSAATARAADREARPRLHHDLVVTLSPDAHRLVATDRVTFPQGLDGLDRTATGALLVRMHAALELASDDPAYVVEALPEEKPAGGGEEPAPDDLRLRAWALRPAAGTWPAAPSVALRFSGAVHHPPVAEAEDYGRSFSRTPGTIGPEGAVLTRATWWVPSVGEDLLSFRLAVELPAGWDAVSQGRRVERKADAAGTRVVWECAHPMEEVYLIASRFALTEREAPGLLAQAYLRTPDPALAARYLEATVQYVDMYRRLIGPYPFEKFALVENFWETGYGMPSFTLLGSQVIRLPFILHSSYPHEILHNWWGNSVYVDWQTGNWCEGLTAYVADHLIREGQGRGAEYRLDTLKKYRAYVRGGKDFPLREFRSRHSGATEAVGYGKSLMLFHMLRRRLGDDAFRAALARFYAEMRWKAASFADVARVFSDVAKEDLRPFVTAWVERAGAPVLSTKVVREGLDTVRVQVDQAQEGEPFPLRVPVALTVLGRKDAVVVEMDASARTQFQRFTAPGAIVRVDVDPELDVFRRLDAAEVPATLGELFGAEKVTIVLPAATDPQAAAWRALADGWKRSGADVEVVEEGAFTAVPAGRSVWVLGAQNAAGRFVAERVAAFGAGLRDAEVDFGETRVPRDGHSFVLVARHPASEEAALGWVGTSVPAAVPGLARKLPHYGKYSWLAFSGAEPTNVGKGQWPATGSPLVTVISQPSKTEVPPRASLPERAPLARLAPAFDAERLLGHVRFLADERLEGRGNGSKGLEEATAFVAKAFAEMGLKPGGDEGTWFQAFSADGGPDGKPVAMRNVVAVLPGTDARFAGRAVVVGAHVDHLGRGWPDVREGMAGQVHNGADDNASGVAVLLEVARSMAAEPRPRPVVFVVFSGEEWGLKGSAHFVKATAAWPAKDALAMVNLDTVGRLEGKKLLVLGTSSAREWPFIAMGVAATTGVDATAVPDDPQGSDQASFRAVGVPAVQLFTGATVDYHRPTDDVEKVDAAGLVRVAVFLRETLDYLAARPEPLHASDAAAPAAPGGGEGRKVLFGTMPDFAFPGPGVKVDSVVPGSPAEKAGIAKGDVLVSMGGEALPSLRAYSELLKRHKPGDLVRVRWTRDGAEREADVTLAAR